MKVQSNSSDIMPPMYVPSVPQPPNSLPAQQLSFPSLQELAKLLSPLRKVGLHYYRQDVYLDGLTFESCSFENCRFITKNGTFVLRNCRIYGPETVFIYQGEALRVARLYEFMNASVVGKTVFPGLFPPMDRDGRITIE